MNKEYMVTKSNYFIMNSSYDLSLEEQRLILTLASMVQPQDEDFKIYKFKISEFMKLLGVTTKTKYSEIPKVTKNLMKKVFDIKEEGRLIQIAWLSSVVYTEGSGMVELEFSPRLKPYMLKLNSMFTRYKLENILSMKSKYSPRVYEILKCNEFKKQGIIEISVEELRRLLKAEKIYPKYNDFKRKVLEKSQEELNKFTDIKFAFEDVKTGRKVTAIRFYIESNANNEVLEEVCIDLDGDHIELIMEMMSEHKIKEKEATAIYASADGNMEHISKVYNHFKNKNSSNFVGLMIAMVKPGRFIEPKKSIPKNGFNNFKGRDYTEDDMDELEKKLLGWDNDDEE